MSAYVSFTVDPPFLVGSEAYLAPPPLSSFRGHEETDPVERAGVQSAVLHEDSAENYLYFSFDYEVRGTSPADDLAVPADLDTLEQQDHRTNEGAADELVAADLPVASDHVQQVDGLVLDPGHDAESVTDPSGGAE